MQRLTFYDLTDIARSLRWGERCACLTRMLNFPKSQLVALHPGTRTPLAGRYELKPVLTPTEVQFISKERDLPSPVIAK